MTDLKASGGPLAALREGLVRAVGLIALLIPVYFAYAALGTKFGLHDWSVGLRTLTFEIGPMLLMAAAGLALIALGAALLVKPRKGAITALVALAVPAAGLVFMNNVRTMASAIPPIHDISTNLADPPAFSADILAARAQTRCVNDLDFATKQVGGNSDPTCVPQGREPGPLAIDLHRDYYTDIQPIVTPLDPQAAYARALEAARSLDWTLENERADDGVIEAAATSFWFGFVDDIVIRVRPKEGGGSVVDLRSVSRVGVSDLGANAARIRAFDAAFSALQA